MMLRVGMCLAWSKMATCFAAWDHPKLFQQPKGLGLFHVDLRFGFIAPMGLGFRVYHGLSKGPAGKSLRGAKPELRCRVLSSFRGAGAARMRLKCYQPPMSNWSAAPGVIAMRASFQIVCYAILFAVMHTWPGKRFYCFFGASWGLRVCQHRI